MASKFGGVPVNEPLEKNEDLSSSKFGGVPVKADPFVNQEAKPSVGFGENLYRTGVGALRDTAQATAELIEDAGGLVGSEFNIPDLPKVEEPTYTGGRFIRDAAGFLIPYAGLSKVAKGYKAATTTGKIAKPVAIGATAEQFAFSPDEERISNLIQSYPSLENPITEYLQADPNDSAAEGRFKMALEGAGLGVAVEGVLRGFGRLKARPTEAEEIIKTETKVDEPSVIDTTTTVEQAKREAQPITPERPIEATKAGNINLNKLETTDDIKNIIFDISKKNDDFIDARRGVVKFGSDGEELAALAKESGLDEEQLLKRQKGEAFNVETAYAARVLQLNSAENVFSLSIKAKGKDASAQDLINLQEAITKHAAILEQVAGITAEAGRALRGFREMAKSEGAVKERLINEYITQKGGMGSLKDMAEAISKLDSPDQIARFSREAYKATTQDKIQEAWINALLSSPSTHAVNVLSNALVAASRIPEYGIATVLGAARRGSDKVTPTEFGARVLGNVYGTLDGLRAFGRAIVDPESVSDPLTKIELQRQNSISGIKGDIVRLPGRFLTAEDALFKGIGYRQELWGQAIRQAKKEGKGIKRAFEILENPEKNFPDIHLASQDIARYQTFTNPLGKTGQTFQDMIKRHPKSRYIVPFFRTPVNIVKYAGQRTPLGVFAKSYKEAIKKGGAEADLARARVIVGSSVMASITYLANEGLVTGRGPSDNRERNILRETGWQPYSIKIDDTYYGYNRFEPAGILFGLAADSVDIYNYANEGFIEGNEGELSELANMLAASVTQNLTNKTFLSGITSMLDAVSDPGRYGEDWITRFATSFVPTAVYYARKSDDPLVRDAESLMDRFYNRIPGLSEKLPARRNVFGETIQYTGTYSPKFLGKFGKTFSPITASKITNDTVFNELARLKITPSIPKRNIGGVKLTAKQYQDMLSEMIPLQVKSQLEFMINSPDWKTLLDSQKEQIIKDVILKNQRVARDFTRVKNPQIISDEISKLMEQLK